MKKIIFTDDLKEILENCSTSKEEHHEVWVIPKGKKRGHFYIKVKKLNTATAICQWLEEEGTCWTEIRTIITYQSIHRRYKEVED